MGLTFIAFEGYEIIVQAGEEVKNPRKTIPRAVFLSLAIVVPIYMFVAFVAIGAVNPGTNIPTFEWLAQHAELGVAEAARQFMPFGTILLLIGGILSTMSALNATTYSSTRVSYAMGRDRNLPNAFAEVNPWTRTPHKALFFSGALIMFMAVAVPIQDVAAASDIMFLLLFLQVNIAVITIRKKYGDRLQYGYLMPFFPIVPILGIVTKLFLALFMFNYSPVAWYFTIVWLAAGFVIYYYYARPRIQDRDRTPVILQEQRTVEAPSAARYRVLVPIANPASLPALLQPAIKAAIKEKGKILLLHVITLPDQLPLSAGGQYIEPARALTNKALEIVAAANVPAEAVIRISHRPADAIIHTAHERKVELMVMGWHGESRSGASFIGRNVDHILEQVNCTALLIQQKQTPPYQRILIPIADLVQTARAVNTAHLLSANGHAAVDIVHVFPPSVTEPERRRFMHALQLQIDGLRADYPELAGDVITVNEIVAPGVVDALVEAASDHDCVILGATRDSWLKQQLLGSKPGRIAQQVEAAVTLVSPKSSRMEFGMFQFLHYVRGGYRRIQPAIEKELEDQGILLPHSQQNEKDLHTAVNSPVVLTAGILGLVAVIAMYIGYGSILTWIGAVLFFIALGWFTWLSIQGVTGIKR